jgi:hypothetical protein
MTTADLAFGFLIGLGVVFICVDVGWFLVTHRRDRRG